MIHYRDQGYCHILTVVDVFSRYAWAWPLKSKTGAELVGAFTKIFHSTSPPHLLQTDQGKEFENKTFQAFLQRHAVHHFSVKSAYKCALVERFNRTLKSHMFRYFTYTGSQKWVKVLPDLLTSYNSTTHRALPNSMTPLQASEAEHHERVWSHQEQKKRETSVKAKMKVGDSVRISKWKKTFEKGYLPNWSEEIFTVARVDQQPSQPVMYVLKDVNGETIEGKFYEQEVQKVGPSEWYAVERVLRRRGTKSLVKFLGYPGHFWVKDLKKI
jgi:hypothetical protein